MSITLKHISSVSALCIVLQGIVGLSCNLEIIPDTGPFVCGQMFTDPRDGKSYKTIWIADDGSHNVNLPGKCWMAENLDFNTFNFHSNCYSMDSDCDTFGRMYSTLSLANVCMNGWHIATNEEWSDLFRTYGWTEALTGNGPIFFGDSSAFLPGGITKLDLLMGGSCLEPNDCSGINEDITFWCGPAGANFCFFNKGGSADVWATAVIVGATDLRFYVRCVKD